MKPGRIIVKARRVRLNYQARIGRVVTQVEAAAGMGMDPAMLSRIEKGKTNGAEWETLARMCSYYEVSICELLEYSEDDTAVTENDEDGLEWEGDASETHTPTARPSSLARRPMPVLA